ncbi:ribonuclease H-like domain-containing protein [Piptocephalis cylindrospora]|uniref:Ribonuclease n=1 Tax=Piptocephalis cylindrospora TaxID=1907219 RepID=A0A4P9Y5V5_9FUNG|nr:ribonuclease H-like domain-containing protein [Piptocephalis cylindrospora]|eukprot:RKP14377.1 ribonuclease H-like domain-containing protein [Piptocephalis cylindrospora]
MPATRPEPLTQSYSHYSSIPEKTMEDEGWILGVDEAGRGPVLGPMVYGVCYCPKGKQEELKDLGFADSKTLDKGERDSGLGRVIGAKDWLGWAVKVLSPQDISSGMLRSSVKYNLNQQALDATVQLVKGVIDLGIPLTELYVDTVGQPNAYQASLATRLPRNLKITVTKKADSLFPIVSAASICAKVTRDTIMEKWMFAEVGLGPDVVGKALGSGYPSDPKTVQWLKRSVEPIFGFPGICRFSWGTCERLLDEFGKAIRWYVAVKNRRKAVQKNE